LTKKVRNCWGNPKSPSLSTWTFSFVPQAQHHLTEGQYHFERSENIISHFSAQMNDVALRANDVGFRPMMLRFAQTESCNSVLRAKKFRTCKCAKFLPFYLKSHSGFP